MNKLALFDIDHTTLEPSNVHHDCFTYACEKVYGIKANIHDIEIHGFTDQKIIIDIMKFHGLKDDEILPKIKECMEAMADYYSKHKTEEKLIVYEGVKKLFEMLDGKGVIVGLITGNVKRIALEKFNEIGLGKYIKVGGFGTDGVVRADLVKKAIERAEKLGFVKEGKNVFVFGDTPHDIDAAKVHGAVTIVVSKGHYSKEELKKAGADYIFDDLSDTEKILKIIL